MSIRYPKYKNGEELVRPVPVPPTYKYVHELLKSLFQIDKKLKNKMSEFQRKIPRPLCSKFEKVDRGVVIGQCNERNRKPFELYRSCK